MSTIDARERLKKHFADPTDQLSRWAQLWENEDFLPWDRGLPNPALVDMLSEKQNILGTCFKDDSSGEKQRKKALVPGCGRGYDVLLLASFGYDAYGLEVSEKAVQLCVQEQMTNGYKYPVQDGSVGAGKAIFLQGDFFSDDWTKDIPSGPDFDLIYDYTVKMLMNPNRVWKCANENNHFVVPVCDASVNASGMGIAPIPIACIDTSG